VIQKFVADLPLLAALILDDDILIHPHDPLDVPYTSNKRWPMLNNSTKIDQIST
jgi:hypothetical protein